MERQEQDCLRLINGGEGPEAVARRLPNAVGAETFRNPSRQPLTETAAA